MGTEPINNIYIIGLGALGAMYASKLQQTVTNTVKIIADQQRVDKYRNSVFTVNGKTQIFDYITPGQDVAPADLIIVAVKDHTLSQAIDDIKSFIGPKTIIISLLNGISSEEQIGNTVGMNHLLHAYGVGMDAVRTGTAISYANMGKIVFGDRNHGGHSAHTIALKNLFERSGVPFVVSEDIERALWTKFMLNVGINQASTILNASYKAFQSDTEARKLMVTAAQEVILLSQKYGINLTEDDLQDCLRIVETLSPKGKTSMLQDMEAGRKTEVEIFAGAVLEMGKKHDIPTIVNETFYRIIKFKESMQIN